jgi:hypothetical protein
MKKKVKVSEKEEKNASLMFQEGGKKGIANVSRRRR